MVATSDFGSSNHSVVWNAPGLKHTHMAGVWLVWYQRPIGRPIDSTPLWIKQREKTHWRNITGPLRNSTDEAWSPNPLEGGTGMHRRSAETLGCRNLIRDPRVVPGGGLVADAPKTTAMTGTMGWRYVGYVWWTECGLDPFTIFYHNSIAFASIRITTISMARITWRWKIICTGRKCILHTDMDMWTLVIGTV